MEMIASNKLYIPILDQNVNKENKEKTEELLKWMNNYNYLNESAPSSKSIKSSPRMENTSRKSILSSMQEFPFKSPSLIPSEVLLINFFLFFLSMKFIGKISIL